MQNSYTQDFKVASTTLLLTIVQKIDQKKHYKLFQKELHIKESDFNQVVEEINIETIVVDEQINKIREELSFNRFKIMNFLMMLNRSIIIDGCNIERYQKFENIRDTFLKKL